MVTEACKKGHIRINGDIAKASREVFIGDEVAVRKDQIQYQMQVLGIPQSRVGVKLVDLYRKDQTPEAAFKHAELVRLSQDYYRKKGEGRPTKKDRRALDNLLTEYQETQ